MSIDINDIRNKNNSGYGGASWTNSTIDRLCDEFESVETQTRAMREELAMLRRQSVEWRAERDALKAACESALEDARERDEDLGANCWPQVRAVLETNFHAPERKNLGRPRGNHYLGYGS